MTAKQATELGKKLCANGYSRFTQALSSNESYGYFKSFDDMHDENNNKIPGYQIEYRFWDWTKYGETGKNEFGCDVIIISSGWNRCDLVLTTKNFDIDRIEKIGMSFNEMCEKEKLGQFEK